MRALTLAIDAMSGDYGPVFIMPAVLQALADYPQFHFLLVGQPDELLPYCSSLPDEEQRRVQIITASKVIDKQASLRDILRLGAASSMAKTFALLQQKKAQACVSAGNTQALVGLANRLMTVLPGIKRPALLTLLPHTMGKRSVLLDIGANLHCDSRQLCQLALLGQAVAQAVLSIENPAIALLNIGEEENKGHAYIQQAADWLKTQTKVNYSGFIESNALFTSPADVIVCDGFSGNVVLKTLEGMAALLNHALADMLAKKEQEAVKQRLQWLDPRQYNGACLVGYEEIIVKSHGGADKFAFYSAIKQAILLAEQQLPKVISQRLTS